jgi:hypothetical protein
VFWFPQLLSLGWQRLVHIQGNAIFQMEETTSNYRQVRVRQIKASSEE